MIDALIAGMVAVAGLINWTCLLAAKKEEPKP